MKLSIVPTVINARAHRHADVGQIPKYSSEEFGGLAITIRYVR